ncbi:YqiA/YcfP family alpha/beta fold hydrolase [Mastigocoleus sp. MO_188.B34]|uniref:YqiA/YcfP family alpha/beta fold hydrolase n=1 Tax=Mastigocoleus sp. MO_188.B34 TaxID=3036635 RepID=UPI00260CD059|nr:YqiA/YcfP family alpha/beta fold hydrolase [Mastigocoleus sp. MO_188.B34]MDJ0695093.1 YqiA/YcfP family alpha/beta fold hydrolase [Mastigocoleus sp. MO_188.B34]
MQYIYLHGFASSPNSNKARYIEQHFAENKINLRIPDLNNNDFSHLTITRQVKQVTAYFDNVELPVTLIGFSLGGLTAVHLGEKHPIVKRLILLAPAFGFLSHWLAKLGEEKIQRWKQEKYLMVYHYREKRELPLSYEFLKDATQYSEEILKRPIPTLILHGKNDEVIPIEASRDFARQRPWVKLVELDSDHSLGDVLPQIWQEIQSFCWNYFEFKFET